MTPEEARLRDEVADLARRLADKDALILEYRTEVEALKSQLKVRDVEIAELAAVIARNQKRVEAETAEYAQRVALATDSVQPRQG